MCPCGHLVLIFRSLKALVAVFGICSYCRLSFILRVSHVESISMLGLLRQLFLLCIWADSFNFRIYPRRLNKGYGSLLPHTYHMLPAEGRRLQRPKRCINNNQDEDSPDNITHTNNTSSQKYRGFGFPDEGRRLQLPKRCINNNQDEDSPNNTTQSKFYRHKKNSKNPLLRHQAIHKHPASHATDAKFKNRKFPKFVEREICRFSSVYYQLLFHNWRLQSEKSKNKPLFTLPPTFKNYPSAPFNPHLTKKVNKIKP